MKNLNAVFTMLLLALMTTFNSARADIFRFRFGVQDNYQPPQELASPSANLQALYNSVGPPFRRYDQGGDDRHFLETIDRLPVCIDGAVLFTHVLPNDVVDLGNFARGTTDIIRFLFTHPNLSGVQVGPHWTSHIGNPNSDATLLPNNWGNNVNNYPNGQFFAFDMSALPLGTNNSNGSTSNLIPAMEQWRHLNIEISDDTLVDYIQMNVFTPLTGDINGDGTVDNSDVALAILLDGQQPPNGVGDTNGDNILNNIDVANILGNFGATCIPEPTGIALTMSGLFAVIVSRHRTAKEVFKTC